MPTGYSLSSDTPLIKQAKKNSVVSSNVGFSLPCAKFSTELKLLLHLPVLGCDWVALLHLSVQVKYKEAYEMMKARAYTLHPEGVNFVNARKAHKINNDVRQSTALLMQPEA